MKDQTWTNINPNQWIPYAKNSTTVLPIIEYTPQNFIDVANIILSGNQNENVMNYLLKAPYGQKINWIKRINSSCKTLFVCANLEKAKEFAERIPKSKPSLIQDIKAGKRKAFILKIENTNKLKLCYVMEYSA